MARESAYTDKVDIRTAATSLLQLSPIILVIIYILEYSYAFQFLAQFGVTPEEVGISEIKLLTRAALLTLVVVSLYGMLFVMVGVVIVVRNLIQESSHIRRFLEKLNLMEHSKVRNRSSITENLRNTYKRARTVRIGGALSFAGTLTIVILIVNFSGLRLDISATLSLAAIGLMLTAALFMGWKKSNVKYLTLASGMALGIVLLGLTTYFGGTRDGIGAVRNGRVTSFASALGIDILQVHPEWLNPKVVPPQYSQNQDLLELGSDAGTAFLYDCWTGTTYRIPLDDVVLTYPLYFNQPNSTILRRLRCR